MTPPSSKRIWTIPLLFAVLVACFGAWCNLRLRQTLESQLRGELAATIEANATALGIWMTNQMNLATALATEPATRDLALRLLSTNPSTNPPSSAAPGPTPNRGPNRDPDATPGPDPGPGPGPGFGLGLGPGPRRGRLNPEVEAFEQTLRTRLDHIGYSMAQLVNTNFTILAGAMRGRPGANATVLEDHAARYTELFASGHPVIITPFKPPRPQGRFAGPPPNRFDRPDRFERPDRTNRSDRSDRSDRFRPPPGGPPHFRGDLTLMQVAAPISDATDTIRGALALIIDPDKEFSRILSVARSGRSGETYAFDQRGLLISRSRFDDQLRALGLLEAGTNSSSALAIRLSDPGSERPATIVPENPNNPTRPLTLFVSNAIAGGTGVGVTPVRDYRGIPVVGAWRWLPHQGFGIVTQIDATEAFQPLRVLKLLFLVLFLLLLLAAGSLLLASFANLAWRKRVDEVELQLRQLGQYTLEEKIGAGGMGVVYRARHALLRRDTAVKLLLPSHADAESVRRFEREVCLTCRLTHPNTIQVYDYGRTPDGVFYYAMEFLSGINLHDLVRRFGPVPEPRAVHILTHICDALAEAHGLGLVHRDIKPANVFLCHRGGIPDSVKVLDFGLVREIHRPDSPSGLGETSATTITGTPSFMPPEALRDPLASDPRSDLYSVGALAYFLLTGERVFDADNLMHLYDLHLTSTPIPPGQRSPNPVSPELESIILRCLAKTPDERPPSAPDLRRRLERTPHAQEWNLEARTAWWATHSLAPSTHPAHPSKPGSPTSHSSSLDLPTVEGTLAIDLNQRQTPG